MIEGIDHILNNVLRQTAKPFREPFYCEASDLQAVGSGRFRELIVQVRVKTHIPGGVHKMLLPAGHWNDDTDRQKPYRLTAENDNRTRLSHF